jgi:hypothetical protein
VRNFAGARKRRFGAAVAVITNHTETGGFGKPAQRIFDEIAAVLLPEETVVARGKEFAAVGDLDQQKTIGTEQVFQCFQRLDRRSSVLDGRLAVSAEP